MNCKRILGIALLAIALAPTATTAQNIVDNYSFSTTIDSTAWIAGVNSAIIASPTGTVTSIRSDRIDIGFTFNLGGSTFTQFSTNVNGTIRLGSSLISGSGYFAQPLGSSCYAGRVEPFGWRGQFDSTCYTRYATVGDSGSRVMVVETRMGVYGQDSTYVTFQVQFFEATGSIRFVYGPAEGLLPQMTRQCGVARTTSDIIFIEQESHEVFRFGTSCTQTTAAGVWPETWRCYTMEPDASPCPYPGDITVVSNNPDSTVLSWPAVAGASYHLTIANADIDTVLTDTSICITGINGVTTYSGTLQTICADGSESYRVREFSFTTANGPVNRLPWIADFENATAAANWNITLRADRISNWERRTYSGNGYMLSGSIDNSSYTADAWLISPAILLPTGANVPLMWDYRSLQSINRYDTPTIDVMVAICDSTDDIDTSVAAWTKLMTLEGLVPNYKTYCLTLEGYSGHRVRVAFARHGFCFGNANIDNVRIGTADTLVRIYAPLHPMVGDTAELRALYVGVDTIATPLYWTSSKYDRNEASMIATPDSRMVDIVYATTGLDTITLQYGNRADTLVVLVKDCATASIYPWRDDFENGTDCWTLPSDNGWYLHRYPSCAYDGSCYMRSKTDPETAHNRLLSNTFVMPSAADIAYLSLIFHARNTYNNTDAHLSVYFASDSTNAETLLIDTVIGWTTYRQIIVPLDNLAGQTGHFVFEHWGTSFTHDIYLDNVEVRYPVISHNIPDHAYVGDINTFIATISEVSSVGFTYSWRSSMFDLGQADTIGDGDDGNLNIVYHSCGVDTIIVSATNAYGSFVDTIYVRVCPVQNTIPWVANFINELPCWQVISGACNVDNNYGYLSFTGWPTAVATPPVYVPNDGNVVLEYSCAYSYLYGSTMVMVTTDMVHFDTIGNAPFTDGTHPSTRIALGAYAGQYVRVVFKATGEFLQYYLTSVQIRYANEPVVQAEADDGYFPGTPVNLTASLLEGDTVNLTYSWASTMTQRGDATLTFDGGPQAILVPSVGGPDTVTVWATNNHGTDSTTIVVNIKPCATVDSLPWVEDFSNQFTCWWQPAGSQWSPDNTGIMACVINSPMTGDNWLISRAIELPTLPSVEGEGMQLQWDAAAIFANSHTYSVWITTGDYRDTGNYEPLATYSSTLPTFNSGWNTPRVDLSAYAGQTMHLAFRYQTHFYNISSFPGILAIDNVRILDTRPPQVAIIPPARCFADDTVVYRANLIHGVQSGMSYTWQSAMEQQELADVYFDDSLIYVVYHAAGSDTVSLVASNAYGSDTAWTTMTVKNCPAVTVPWYEDFEVVNPCWSGAWTPDHITYTWLDSTTHVMHSSPNSWYASPWIDLPDTTGLQLMWNKNGSAANSFMKIFVSPTGSIEPADFTDTLLYGETPNGFDSVSLDAYAGRRIRVAFAQRASSNYSDSYSLDDVRVDYNRTAPQVSLVAPLFASSFGDAITATATLGNIAPGVTYCWSSTFGVVTAMGAQCHIGYTVAGEDTITVVASNPYGSDTALAVVTVYDCGGMTTVPFFEDFSNITTTTYRVRGWLPPCWNATWTGDTPGPAPHVITTDGYQWLGNIPDNALLMQAGTSTGYGPLAEVVLPRFADSLHHLMMAFDYRFESAYYGTLVVGYYDDTVFTAVDTLARHADNYRRDTVLFAMHFFANNPHIAIRWQHSGGSWFAVAIDNLEVYSIADSTEGINELSIFNSQFSIYPNPASTTVTVETDTPATLTMTDVTGRECGRWKVENGKNTIDVSSLHAGVYFVRLDSTINVRKLIIR